MAEGCQELKRGPGETARPASRQAVSFRRASSVLSVPRGSPRAGGRFVPLGSLIRHFLFNLTVAQQVAPRAEQLRCDAVELQRRPVVPGRALVWTHIDSDLRREPLRLKIGCEDVRFVVWRLVQLRHDRNAK